jgi:membrane-associated HD superfamily phosphohydrolase
MGLWVLSFFTGLIVIISLYFSLHFANPKIRIGSVIVLLLILVGETFDVLAELVLNQLILLFAETMELFVAVGFFVMSFYIYQKKEKLSKKRRKLK